MKLLISPPNNPANLKPGDRVRHVYGGRVGRIFEMLYRQSRAAVRWDDGGPACQVAVELLERKEG